jgi:fructokinase
MTTGQTVTCIGELIVDFISTSAGVALQEAVSFQRCAGGAAANVAVGLARLGVQSAFVGKVGNDAFGRFLLKELQGARVDTKEIVLDAKHKTRLAFVSLDKSGERKFEFWEKHPADEHLRQSDIDRERIRKSTIVHMSSFLLLNEPSRSTAFAIAQYCSRAGCSVSFDPNLRHSLWDSPAEARRVMLKMVSFTRILRLNTEEAYFLTTKRSSEAAARYLRSLGPSIVVITRGHKGCYLQTGSAATFVDGFSVRAVDTTGCGDAFLAGLLSALAKSRRKPEEMNELELRKIGRFANAAGALTAMKYGVIPALPTLANVRKFLKAHSRRSR